MVVEGGNRIVNSHNGRATVYASAVRGATLEISQSPIISGQTLTSVTPYQRKESVDEHNVPKAVTFPDMKTF